MIKFPKLTLPKSKKGVISLAVVLVLFLITSISIIRKTAGGRDSDIKITGYTVEKGDIITSITGTGTVEPIEQYTISSIARGDVTSDYITVGQEVKKGDLLYEIDSTEARNNIEKAQISLQKQELNYSQSLEDAANLNVKSPIGGTITKMYVKVGDQVQNNSKICDIIDSSVITVTLPFLCDDAKNLYIGQSAYITLDTTNETFTGKVKRVATGTYSTAKGAVVSDVELTFENPGALNPGASVTAVVGDYACNDSGVIEYSQSTTVSAKTSGKVENINFGSGDRVNKNSVIVNLSNTSSSTNTQSSALSLRDSQIALDNQLEALEDYSITAPIDGTIIEKTYKVGDTLDGNKSSLAIVADMSKLTFTMNIDELDIKSLSVGQEVIVSADAVEGKTFLGTVSNISIIGTSGSGVTTYPVDVIIEDYSGLLPGMNVDATIIAKQSSDVLRIPLNSVYRGNMVLVTEKYAKSIGAVEASDFTKNKEPNNGKKQNSDNKNPEVKDKSKDNPPVNQDNKPNFPTAPQIVSMPNTPDGYVYLRITIGQADESYVEVTSGLTEGAEVFVISSNQAVANTNNNSPMGGMGAMGGMPGGRMPSGGMPSGGFPNRGMPSGGMSDSGGNRMSGGGMR